MKSPRAQHSGAHARVRARHGGVESRTRGLNDSRNHRAPGCAHDRAPLRWARARVILRSALLPALVISAGCYEPLAALSSAQRDAGGVPG